jgi:hypothetical protein
MIPVEVTQAPWHATGFWDWVDHWQTLIAGVLAFAAGVGTVVVAMRVIAATREQTAVARKQIETTLGLEQDRVAEEVSAFRAMLAAAMTRVLDEAAWARKTYAGTLVQTGGASVDALIVRQCITKGAFAELRGVCVRRRDPLTGEFLELEREIDSFALQCEDGTTVMQTVTIRKGRHAGLDEQLALIETKATALRQKAAGRIF